MELALLDKDKKVHLVKEVTESVTRASDLLHQVYVVFIKENSHKNIGV